MDAITIELIDLVFRGEAKLHLRDAHDPHDQSKDYWVAFNATRRALQALEARLKTLGLDKPQRTTPLEQFMAERANGGER